MSSSSAPSSTPPTMSHITTTTTTTPSRPNASTVVIVARHGERLDYVQRDQGINWVQENEHGAPYDPPLTAHGIQQASKLGQQLVSLVEAMPPITAVYSSPFLRCRQTAAAIVREINRERTTSTSSSSNLKVQVEEGLAESINESWYRSWSLPGSNGTWGFRMEKDNGSICDDASILTEDPSRLHPKSLVPVQSLLSEWKRTTTDDYDTNGDADDDTLLLLSNRLVDYTHESKTKIQQPYQLYPRNLESQKDQRQRMYQSVQQLKVPGQTIILVSHGGPVTHLYEQLSGNTWHVHHGESTYCCYSIYQQQTPPLPPPTACSNSTDGANNTNISNNSNINNDDDDCWEAIVVNESKYLDEKLVTERHDDHN